MRKTLLVLCLLLIAILALGKEIVFWTAPNPLQEKFWKPLVEEWNANHPDVQIKWSPIPASGSSEEAILTAIAAGSSPDICTNIFSGFAAQLIEADQLVALESLPGYADLIAERKMETIVEGWKFGGKNYVLPIYSNPMMFWWRKDLLEELGYTRAPRTYSEVYEVSEKYSVKNEKFGALVVLGRNWWDRWFDFINYYYAASGGKSYLDIEKARATFNDDAGKKVATFIDTMFRNEWTAVDLGNFPFYYGVVLGGIKGPWDLNWAKEQFPEVYPNILIAPPPVPDDYPADEPVHVFADTKGLVMFKSCKYKDEAWEFIKWVFSNVQNDLRWMEITNMPPARGDLTTNPIFTSYMEENPYFKAFAEYVPYAIPPALTTFTVDIQDAMTQYLIEPIMYGKKTPEQALKEAASKIRRILF
ncbi:sugar ABC transporter substrate-binding protein [Kosmotoga arenicorallina S304]|uniref:Sugar ABC transporter substrate-binding protein n=1 Tax=Kosmotoga arenicorallina S304 TaxID=1453497 RepID=A0A176JYY2_9BACT|nr:extracellular solute-binding protein [Kosmotoga arenicorallina]OAA29165.1 sugar ABC transporter substrate-binding protein [Kosmotoga arenicorallina S304]